MTTKQFIYVVLAVFLGIYLSQQIHINWGWGETHVYQAVPVYIYTGGQPPCHGGPPSNRSVAPKVHSPLEGLPTGHVGRATDFFGSQQPDSPTTTASQTTWENVCGHWPLMVEDLGDGTAQIKLVPMGMEMFIDGHWAWRKDNGKRVKPYDRYPGQNCPIPRPQWLRETSYQQPSSSRPARVPAMAQNARRRAPMSSPNQQSRGFEPED